MTNFEKCLSKKGRRKNSVAVIGALFGDEGKGRITDELTSHFLKSFKKVIVYRDNGGSNAGHVVSVGDEKIDLHQIGSGILQKGCIVVLGKGMVIHPIDLVKEMEVIKETFGYKDLPADFKIDETSTLCLDTHRAFEGVLKDADSGSFGAKASTGRGISPAYADILYRFPVTMKDFLSRNWKDILSAHYARYEKWIKGMGGDLKNVKVKRFRDSDSKVGSRDVFLRNLEYSRKVLKNYSEDIHDFLEKEWNGSTPFVFEKAQGVGIDTRWAVYPDSTASNCCLDGITSSTEGVINANDISARIGVIKSTYTSSVGKRMLPTMMKGKYADRIRKDANEYGATTGRPRDIAYMDTVMLKYFCQAGGIEELAFTHMDIVYNEPVKICMGYLVDKKRAGYRPYQWYLDLIKPVYKNFKPWNGGNLKNRRSLENLQENAKNYIKFISSETGTTPVLLSYGPNREDTIIF